MAARLTCGCLNRSWEFSTFCQLSASTSFPSPSTFPPHSPLGLQASPSKSWRLGASSRLGCTPPGIPANSPSLLSPSGLSLEEMDVAFKAVTVAEREANIEKAAEQFGISAALPTHLASNSVVSTEDDDKDQVTTSARMV